MRPRGIPVWVEVNERGAANAFALQTSLAVGHGPSVETALDSLRLDLAGTRKWLAAHGIADRHSIDEPMRVVQTVPTSVDPMHGESTAFFDWDAQLPADDEIDAIERVMRCSRSDLLSLVSAASEETLDVRLAPKARTLREIMRHVAARELDFAICLHEERPSVPLMHEFGHDLLRRLRTVRQFFQEHGVNRIRGMASAARVRQFLQDGEVWSARKVLRRAAQHEIHHHKQVYRMLLRIRRLPAQVRRASVA